MHCQDLTGVALSIAMENFERAIVTSLWHGVKRRVNERPASPPAAGPHIGLSTHKDAL